MRRLLLRLIRLYQTHISPYKGFRCSYSVRTDGKSCSNFGYDAIQRHGVRVGWLLLQRRFKKCAATNTPRVDDFGLTSRRAHQAGYCDVPIDCHGLDCGHGGHDGSGCGCGSLDCLPIDDCGLDRKAQKVRKTRKKARMPQTPQA